MAALFFSIVLAPLFFGLCWILGRALPKSWLMTGPAPYIQQAILGFSLLIYVLRIPYREDQSLSLAYAVVACLVLFSLGRDAWLNRTWILGIRAAFDLNEIRSRCTPILVIWIPGLLIVLAPVLLAGALTWQHHGPDFDGDLISADYLHDGYRFSDLMRDFRDSTGTNSWWQFQHTPYVHPDFRAVVAVEFFVRSLRFGHAVLTAFLSDATGVPVWGSFFTLCLFANLIMPLVIFDAGRRRNIGRPQLICLTCIFFLSQNYIMLNYEGINIQMIAMSPMLLFILSWREFARPDKSIGQITFIAVLLSSMISLFGEGLQIIAVFFISCLIAGLMFRDQKDSLGDTIWIFIKIAAMTALVAPNVFVDFLLWTEGRLSERFFGGALHGDWSLLAILLSLPEINIGTKLPPIIFLGDTYFGRLVEAAVVMGAAVWAHRRNPRAGVDLGCVALTLFIFSLAGHTYAIWKVAVVLQPLCLLALMELLPDRVGAIGTLNGARVYAGVVTAVGLVTVALYWQHAIPMHVGQFAVDRHLVANKQVALVTPSSERTYLRLSSTGPAMWANGGWRRYDVQPDFSIGRNEDLEIALYYDCDSEGPEACAKIEAKNGSSLPPRTVVPTGQSLRTLLKPGGDIDRKLLNAFILDHFGIQAH